MKHNVILLFLLLSIGVVSCDKNSKDEPNPVTPEVTDPPVTHIYTSEESTEAVVKELKSDGTVVLDAASAKKVPLVGEVIVSSITDAAPLGFLYTVESVQKTGDDIVITTSPATLNEVLPDSHFEQQLEFSLDEEENVAMQVRRAEYHSAKSKNDFELLHFKANLSHENALGGDVVFPDFTKKQYIKTSGSIEMKLGGSFIWDCQKMEPQRCGMTLNGSLSAAVTIECAMEIKPANVKNLRWRLPYETKLKPIVFTVGYVPVVIVPTVQYYYGVLSSSGKVYAKWKPIDVKGLAFDTRLIWSRDANKDDGHWDYGFTPKSDLATKGWKDYLVDMANIEGGLQGEVKLAVWPIVRYKLYNAEAVSLAVGVAPYAALRGELAMKYQASNFNWDDFEIKDNVSLSAGIAVPIEGKTEFKLFKKKIGGTISYDLSVLEVPIVEGANFFPVFNDFIITPEENAKTYDNVHVEAERGATNFTLFTTFETDYGFCYAQIKKDASGKEIPTREWKCISMKSKYPSTANAFKMSADIPTAGLAADATYAVKPYWTMTVGSMKSTWMRKGGKFKTGASKNGGTVVDVVGTKL